MDPANQIVEVYLLNNHSLKLSNVYDKEDVVPVHVLDGLTIDLNSIFPEVVLNGRRELLIPKPLAFLAFF
ncbi:hypothetical protein GCM10008983_07970 [Lentibacillus halophilus]|uniref:Uncharacterized protein n=1 Tax=Lentibacillus halophilus TaxID=295065 RepID=A0ABN0Z640_9BACI